MRNTFELPLFDIVNCLSEAVDLINPSIMSHHKRVAYIASKIALAMDFKQVDYNNVFIASSLHDIGAIAYTIEEQAELVKYEVYKPHKHSILGYLLLKESMLFSSTASIIRFHHVPWGKGNGSEFNGESVPIESHIIHLADRIDILIDRNSNILDQTDYIRNKINTSKNTYFHPKMVERFLEISVCESFWLDITSPQLISILQKMTTLPAIIADFSQLRRIATLFSHIIDFRSKFTATHSRGVAVVSETLARLSGIPDITSKLIGIAGFMHDIGKLAVPNEILDKESPLTQTEFNIIKRHSYYTQQVLNNIDLAKELSHWASSHHEKLDGSGYPFHYKEGELDAGCRILAVADIFTALTEDRPYRKGMAKDEVKIILQKLVSQSAIDSYFVAQMDLHYDEINNRRIESQKKASEEYHEFWKQAKELLSFLPKTVSNS